MLFFQKSLGEIYVVLAAFFLVRSSLSPLQFQAFTEGRIASLIMSGLVMATGVLASGSLAQSGIVRFEIFVLALAGAAMVLLRAARQTSGPPSGNETVLRPIDWFGQLKAQSGATLRIRVLKMCSQTNDSVVAQFADYLGRRIREAGRITVLDRKRIVWWEHAPTSGTRRDDWIWRRGAGLIASLKSTDWQSTGCEALRCACNESLFGHRLRPEDDCIANGKDPSSIAALFREVLPEGIVFAFDGDQPAKVEAFPSTTRREILYGLIQYSKNMFREVRATRFDVTALLHGNEVRLVFVVDKTIDTKRRRAWRGMLGLRNLQDAISSTLRR